MKILAVGVSVRAMVESAVRSGYSMLALDAFGDRDLRLLTECHSLHHDSGARYSPGRLYKASRPLSYDAVAYTANLENHPDILHRLAGGRPVIGNSPDTIRAVRCWEDLYARLAAAGFAVPRTMPAGKELEMDGRRRWLVKPVLSGGGHGIRFLRGAKQPGAPYVIQEYIPGKPCSASFVSNRRDCVVVGVAGQLIGMRQFGSKGFRYCGNILPLPECLIGEQGGIILEQIRRLALFLTREYGLNGINGIDFILSGNRLYLTEVNPRYSASMELIERAYGLPVFRMHAKASLEGKLPEFRLETELKRTEFWGKAILFAQRDAVAPDTRDWLGRGIRDVPSAGEPLRAGNPICTILAHRPSHEETLTDLICQAGSLGEEIYGH